MRVLFLFLTLITISCSQEQSLADFHFKKCLLDAEDLTEEQFDAKFDSLEDSFINQNLLQGRSQNDYFTSLSNISTEVLREKLSQESLPKPIKFNIDSDRCPQLETQFRRLDIINEPLYQYFTGVSNYQSRVPLYSSVDTLPYLISEIGEDALSSELVRFLILNDLSELGSFSLPKSEKVN